MAIQMLLYFFQMPHLFLIFVQKILYFHNFQHKRYSRQKLRAVFLVTFVQFVLPKQMHESRILENMQNKSDGMKYTCYVRIADTSQLIISPLKFRRDFLVASRGKPKHYSNLNKSGNSPRWATLFLVLHSASETAKMSF